MSNTRQFTALVQCEDREFLALCLELDIASQGASVEEARDNLVEAIRLFFETASPAEIEQRRRDEVARVKALTRLWHFVSRVEVRVD